MTLLNSNDCIVVLIDIQDKLVAAVKNCDIPRKAAKLVSAARIMGIPVVISEQYPKGLGPTVSGILSELPSDGLKFEKTNFSILREDGILNKLKSYNKKQIIICGIEAHICVYQTVVELVKEGFEVTVAKDLCASRNSYEFETGIEAMKARGAKISCLEMILFEWLKGAKHPKFKEVQALIK